MCYHRRNCKRSRNAAVRYLCTEQKKISNLLSLKIYTRWIDRESSRKDKRILSISLQWGKQMASFPMTFGSWFGDRPRRIRFTEHGKYPKKGPSYGYWWEPEMGSVLFTRVACDIGLYWVNVGFILGFQPRINDIGTWLLGHCFPNMEFRDENGVAQMLGWSRFSVLV